MRHYLRINPDATPLSELQIVSSDTDEVLARGHLAIETPSEPGGASITSTALELPLMFVGQVTPEGIGNI